MTTKSMPLVSVITPCYNGEPYLAECIESVLNQTYENFEYIIVDNKSTDGSLQTAQKYAELDSRIRIVRNDEFLIQLENYNHTFRQISSQSVYCKMVQADDWMFSNCLEEMVKLAESNPSVGIVCSYTLLDYGHRTRVYLTGLPYLTSVITGLEACRRYLLNGTDCFGNPTVSMVRSDIIRSTDKFYDENTVSPDIDMCFRVLKNHDFGFVHQVLTYTRRYNDSIMSILTKFNHKLLTDLFVFLRYGDYYLEKPEYDQRRREIESKYDESIGESILRRMPPQYWQFQKEALSVVGFEISKRKMLWCLIKVLADLAFNPKHTIERLWKSKRKKADIDYGKVKKYYNIDVE